MKSSSDNDVQVSQQLIKVLESAKFKTEGIIDDLPDVFCILDQEGQIHKGNAQLAKLMQTDTELLVKRNFSVLFSPSHWEIFQSKLSECSNQQQSQQQSQPSPRSEFELALDGLSTAERVIIWNVRTFSRKRPNWPMLYAALGRDISISVILERKNKELEYQKGRAQAIINSSNHGFFTFNKALLIEDTPSKKALELLGSDIIGKSVDETLQIPEKGFSDFYPFMFQKDKWNILKNFSTKECVRQDKILRIEFMPVIESGVIERALGIVTDVTKFRQLEQREIRNRQANIGLATILKAKHLFLSTLNSLKDIDSIMNSPEELRRAVHTLKGEFAFFGCQSWVDVCHNWESAWKTDPENPATDTKFLKDLRDEVYGFIENYKSILNLNEDQLTLLPSPSIESFMKTASSGQFVISSELDKALIVMLSSPVQNHLSWLDDVWKLSALKTCKEVEPIQWLGLGFIFAKPYEDLFKTLIHAIHNASDHGIEKPEERSALGKPKRGSLSITLREDPDFFVLSIKDDGRGANLEKIKKVAQERKISVPDSDEGCLDLLFHQKFSTASELSEISGRGVGLDVIRHAARSHGGDAKGVNYPGIGFELLIHFKKYSFNVV